MIAIIDYGAGNLQSVQKALAFIGAAAEVTDDPRKIARAAGVILPGVGAFGDAMHSMRSRGLVSAVQQAACQAMESKRPFLGVCLGLQLLFSASEESPGAAGLGVIDGTVEGFSTKLAAKRSAATLKIPHMGWNSVDILQRDGLFAGVTEGAYFYFVHSYFVRAARREFAAAETDYGLRFDAALSRGLLWATQFHPEKSGEAGLWLLKNFVNLL